MPRGERQMMVKDKIWGGTRLGAVLYFSIFMLMLMLIPAEESAAVEFTYKNALGDKYRILSRVNERVYINGEYSHRADILNKISASVVDTRDGQAKIEATFLTSESRDGAVTVYELSQEYKTVFWRSSLGEYEIAPVYYMPVVRGVPTFPGRDLSVGESWKGTGEEVHDLRQGFGISDPFQFPISVNYRYLGEGTYEGENADIISIQYTISHRSGSWYERYPLYPQRLSGYSDQTLYWNRGEGRPIAYEENFSIVFDLSSGDSYEFTGAASARVLEATSMDKESVKDDLQRRIDEGQIADTGVRVGDDGVILSLENIQFLPDSAVPLEGELEKLNRVVSLLKLYPDRDILVSGHTALAGTREGRMQLSLDRARTVAAYLKDELAIDDDRLMVEGRGADEPIAPNETAEGMRKNRRVEITILEN
jgi:outer membrane protein OmpA-like peptidoglycan-associated protein